MSLSSLRNDFLVDFLERSLWRSWWACAVSCTAHIRAFKPGNHHHFLSWFIISCRTAQVLGLNMTKAMNLCATVYHCLQTRKLLPNDSCGASPDGRQLIGATLDNLQVVVHHWLTEFENIKEHVLWIAMSPPLPVHWSLWRSCHWWSPTPQRYQSSRLWGTLLEHVGTDQLEDPEFEQNKHLSHKTKKD